MREINTHQTLLISRDIQDGLLISNGHKPAGHYRFWGNDSRENLQDNLRTQPGDWQYRRRQLNYTVNTQNYRAAEWDQIDWLNSIVVYGCSHVFGDGLDDSETISAQLEQITGRPTVNLGAGGSSPQWQLDNQTLVKLRFGEPWATVTVWPCASRHLTYWGDRSANKWGSWSTGQGRGLTYSWNEGYNPGTQLWMLRAQSKMLHQRQWVDLTFGQNISELLDIKRFDMSTAEPARDLAHPGPELARQAAEWISDQLMPK